MFIFGAATFGQGVADALVLGFFLYGAVKIGQVLKKNPTARDGTKKGIGYLLSILFNNKK